ncbi:ATP-binding protein [Ensifer sp.]|uniref:ATP-binding protein n=1 Tax=Ensifer sp. TaxID=1872086 RepID=UPI002E10FDAE|nr:winged helix-turn-helix domain-containing protein [Ensifer sp.]
MEEELYFAPFSIVPARRSLTRDGAIVALGSRAIDILLFLISSPGELKANHDIVKQVWPDTFVDEANLRVHVSALRKALGDTRGEPQYIANIPGRGYVFVAPVERRPVAQAERTIRPLLSDDPDDMRIFGRDQSIEAVVSQLEKGRLVTIAGPGGIGKSTVARAVAARLGSRFNLVRIDLSEVGAGELVPTVVASRLGVLSRSGEPISAISVALEATPTLVVLDGCEHVVENAARFVEAVLHGTRAVHFLATSREPLRSAGERVHRLLPLALPPSTLSSREALAFPAVQLFVERADACLGGYELSEEDTPVVIDICSRLDGIALAIELAAGRLESMGVAALGKSLTDCFKVLSRGRRTALPRHQTLRAALDWSYLLLNPSEQRALRELSVFRGRFTASAAEEMLTEDATDVLAALVAKSLVTLEANVEDPYYRLLDTTRIYAAEKLAGSSEFERAMARLGNYLCLLLEKSGPTLHTNSAEEVEAGASHLVPSLRACLDWAFGAKGDRLLGARITVAALPLYFKLSLFDECIAVVTASISYLDANPDLDEASRMKLYTALGWPQLIAADEPWRGVAAWTASARIAEKLGDVDHQLRAIWALWVDAINRAAPREGLAWTERFTDQAIVSPDPADSVIGQRMQGATLHWLGRHAEAEAHLEAMLAQYEDVPSAGHSIRFHFDQRTTAHTILSRCKWFLGRETDALKEVEDSLLYAESIRHYASLTNVLAEAACPLALMTGDDGLAAHYIAMLREHTKAMSLDVWRTYGDCFEAELMQRAGESLGSLRLLRHGLQQLRGAGFVLFETMFVSTEARALSGIGRDEEALGVLNAALAKGALSGEAWWLPELHREKAGIYLKQADLRNAAASFEAAIWAAELSGANGLLRRIEGDMADAQICLDPVLSGASAAVGARRPE